MSESDPLIENEKSKDGFGSKTIGTIPGVFLLVNNMTGAGTPLLPLMFQQAGWVVSTITLLLVTILSGLSATMLCEAMKQMPGNKHFQGRAEYATVARFYLGEWPYWITQLLLNLSLLSLNLVSMLETIQVLDWTIVRVFGCTCGLIFEPDPGFRCVCPAVGTCLHQDSPFGHGMVIGCGYLLCLLLIVPLGYLNLDDNIGVQSACTIIQTCIFIKWIITFFMRGFTASAVPAIGTQQASVLGQIVINYAFSVTVPSWCNEKRRSSNVNRTVWTAVLSSTLIYLSVGLLGGFSFPNLNDSDILTAINRASNGSVIDQISVYLFPLIVVASGIPIYSIIIRYNLVENNICSRRWANVWAVLLPWILVIPLTAGNDVFNNVTNITSLLFQLPINLTIPFIIYWKAMRRRPQLKSCLCSPVGSSCCHDVDVPSDADAVASSVNASTSAPKVDQKDPLAPFSVRHPRMGRCLPEPLVRLLDKEYPPATEHFALPKWFSWRTTAILAISCAVICTLIMMASLGLTVWQLVDPPFSNSTNSTNSTCGI